METGGSLISSQDKPCFFCHWSAITCTISLALAVIRACDVIWSLKIAAMWDATLCGLVVIIRHFEVTLCLKSTRLHGVTSQEIILIQRQWKARVSHKFLRIICKLWTTKISFLATQKIIFSPTSSDMPRYASFLSSGYPSIEEKWPKRKTRTYFYLVPKLRTQGAGPPSLHTPLLRYVLRSIVTGVYLFIYLFI